MTNRTALQTSTGGREAFAPGRRARSGSSYPAFGGPIDLETCISCEQPSKLIDHWTGYRVCLGCYIEKRGVLG